MNRKAYSIDLTDGERAIPAPFIPPPLPGGRPRKHSMREVSDRDGARLLLDGVGGEFPCLEHVWADMGYRGKVVEWIKEHLW